MTTPQAEDPAGRAAERRMARLNKKVDGLHASSRAAEHARRAAQAAYVQAIDDSRTSGGGFDPQSPQARRADELRVKALDAANAQQKANLAWLAALLTRDREAFRARHEHVVPEGGEQAPRVRLYPVVYAPCNDVIGSASTERGAIQVTARKVSKLACERFTASLRERLDGSLAWFTGPQLITKR